MNAKRKKQIKELITKVKELKKEIITIMEEEEKEYGGYTAGSPEFDQVVALVAYLFEAEGSADNVLHSLKQSIKPIYGKH